MLIFSFDVESIGLYGEAFGVGWVVIETDTGDILNADTFWCDPALAHGLNSDREWVRDNVSFDSALPTHQSPQEVAEAFWSVWKKWKDQGAAMVADCAFPVETNFLQTCAKVGVGGTQTAPYPLIDVCSVRLAVGLNPVGYEARRPNELPAHNPRADAEQSARLFIEACKRFTDCDAALVKMSDVAEQAYNDGYWSCDAKLPQDWKNSASCKSHDEVLGLTHKIGEE